MGAERRFFIFGSMSCTEVFAGIAVRDRDAAIEFYENKATSVTAP